MVQENPNSPPLTPFIDPKSGFCSQTKTYHSLRRPVPLPPSTAFLSITSYFSSFLHQHSSATVALLDATTHRRILHSQLQSRVKSLAYSLQHEFRLSQGDCAFILSTNSPDIPILYLSLFALGVVVSPSNPSNSAAEILRQVHLTNPTIAFTNSHTAHKLPSSLRQSRKTIILDSPEFSSMTLQSECFDLPSIQISQSDTAAILYSSGTTGNFKGVELTHRNFISTIAGSYATRPARETPMVTLCTVPFFHIYGFLLSFREAALGGTLVMMKGTNMVLMLKTVEALRVTHLAVAPPSVVAMANDADVARGYDLRSLEVVFCAGAALTNSVVEKFGRGFPNVAIVQAYGLTETTGGVTRIVGPDESRVLGSVGRLMWGLQAKIVDPTKQNGVGLPPLKEGELWIKGPYLMKGYVGDKEATDAIMDSDGWLRTGDICYFNDEGFLFCVDRMKDLIKYKAYQVAPAELEHLLQSHPDIPDAAVIPYPDEEAGQVPVAFVVRKSGSLINESQIMDFVAEQVAPYKKIRKVFFVDSIPRNAPGKVLRKELIKQAISATASKL